MGSGRFFSVSFLSSGSFVSLLERLFDVGGADIKFCELGEKRG